MKPPLRIAVLECDAPAPSVEGELGSYGDIFEKLLKAGADELGQPDVVSSKQGLDVSKFDVVNKKEYPRLEEVDAVLLTGSRHNSFDNDEWILELVAFTTKVLRQQRVRMIGVCFGHQIIGRALGAKVGRSDVGWEVSVCLMKLTEMGQRLFDKDMLSIHQMHQDIVFERPDGIESLGSSPRCKEQGWYVKNRYITLQGHPEFTEFIMRALLEGRHASGLFDKQIYSDGMERVANHHDGVKASMAFVKFLLDD